jgi:hypothetical protein
VNEISSAGRRAGKTLLSTAKALEEAQAIEAPRQRAAARAILKTLGFNPDETRAERVAGRWPGLQVRDDAGRPLKFITTKSLKRRSQDYAFSQALAQNMAAEFKAAEEEYEQAERLKSLAAVQTLTPVAAPSEPSNV